MQLLLISNGRQALDQARYHLIVKPKDLQSNTGHPACIQSRQHQRKTGKFHLHITTQGVHSWALVQTLGKRSQDVAQLRAKQTQIEDMTPSLHLWDSSQDQRLVQLWNKDCAGLCYIFWPLQAAWMSSTGRRRQGAMFAQCCKLRFHQLHLPTPKLKFDISQSRQPQKRSQRMCSPKHMKYCGKTDRWKNASCRTLYQSKS